MSTMTAVATATGVSVSRRGIMLVLSSPSGAGKTTITRALRQRHPDLEMSVSVTTRRMRPGEREGVDYYFIDVATFQAMLSRKELLESASVFGNYYGTPRLPVDRVLTAGRDMLFDIDWQGTQQLKDSARADLVSVFILPPSRAELERRLKTRAQDTHEVVAHRMEKSSDEMSHWPEYDYILINNDIDESVARVESILEAERLRRERQVGLAEFVSRLREGH
jgi:guanylate kinase